MKLIEIESDELFEEMLKVYKEEKDYYFYEVYPEVRKELREFIKETKENEPTFVKERRIEYLEKKIKELEMDNKIIFKLFKKCCYTFMGDVILNVSGYFEKKKKLKRFVFELNAKKYDNKFVSEISEEDIEMARDYPIEDLVESKKHFSLCPFHNDHNPSFYTKNNFGYCFSCGWSGDVIKYVMKRDNLNFVEAVKFLK